MEIEKKVTRTVKFGTLDVGDVFIDEDDNVMMVVDKDFGLGDCDNYDGYAVELKTGWHYGFEADDEVIKVSAKMTITD
jgi:uncharacterized membrane protein (UPF0127 family)